MELSIDQKKALGSLMGWFNGNNSQYITLGGYAGTGKTTLISVFRKELTRLNKKMEIAFCSYTGKATRVLKNKLIESKSLYDEDSVSTIHSLIYSPIVNSKKEITGWKKKDKLDRDLIIIDEASMVDEMIWMDLCSFGIRIIAVGDHGQLPPIRGNFNLMEKPTLKLSKIHRQAEDNPIIKLSILARETGRIPVCNYDNRVVKMKKNSIDAQERSEELLRNYNKETLILCGYNWTRVKLNNFIREALGFESPAPASGDRIICLRNNHESQVFNGMLGTIENIGKKNEEWYETEIKMDDETGIYSGLILAEQFGKQDAMNFGKRRSKTLKGDLMDFGYALTVHKAQGGQAKRVILFEERFSKMDEEMWRRWLYTGVTRAEEELFIIGE
ncbi:ATP-dependent RecD-like DNA helicase [Patescibacteria group bacterium]|nr:ATP-dependent RecD-like DNA helicase [Patescibacteria group bacterium]MCG2701849.1 ATP-dependent RecD-like DNA helicase [Candidatus Parcubacteria bacterium]MBU4210101.1 ATP-dependent RecD-like DNA helicase [Patescibacteria group bacterium]MBU4265401.1 ATP-dependent RecD-like DNA helicase [Patescibacteria group bacterium]MBU4390353.1 ATP-dependent RecD-like DNA helicase [Patescibacteria group bacterium]